MAYTPTTWKDGDVITADSLNHLEQGVQNSANENVYSTEETVIGTWIDGKPLYRKVFKFTVTFGGDEEYIIASVSELNIERLTGGYWSGKSSGDGVTWSAPVDGKVTIRYNDENDYSICVINNFTGGTYEFSDSFAVIEYTKTTD